jgi:hypothetical protein
LLIENVPNQTGDRHVQKYFKNAINKVLITELFAQTDRVHRLANFADQVCEGNDRNPGISHALARNCELLLRDEHLTAKRVFNNHFLPEIRLLFLTKSFKYDLSNPTEPPDHVCHLVDRSGNPLHPEPSRNDYRVGRSLPSNIRDPNVRVVSQILKIYAETTQPTPTDVVAMEERFKGVRFNEAQERKKPSNVKAVFSPKTGWQEKQAPDKKLPARK